MGTIQNSFKTVSFEDKDPTRLLILGNGFDLCLGYKTGYKDFVENNNSIEEGRFPFVKGDKDCHALGRFLLKCTQVKKWYDLENVLAEYGKTNPGKEYAKLLNSVTSTFGFAHVPPSLFAKRYDRKERVEIDKQDYFSLVKSLKLYLSSISICSPDMTSVAARFFSAIMDDLLPPTIYTFNYTNLVKIGEAMGLHVNSPVHIHGSLADDNIILGVGDYAELRPSAHYLYKTSNEDYYSSNLFDALDTSDEIYIFGLSLSQVDYPYFEDFFRSIASGKYGKNKKMIRIFTYDDQSRSDILLNLRKMNEGMIKLLGYSDLEIIRTKDNIDEDKVCHIINHLSHKWHIDDSCLD